MSRSLADWLRWQQALHVQWMDLGLERVRGAASRLGVGHPSQAVFTVAGTNGKGSTVALLERLLIEHGLQVGTYTSPHLVRYNERIRLNGEPVTDTALVDAFERIDGARADTSLTVFEFGTLAALLIFEASRCDAWVLEVGLGGRLDAVNIIDPDYSLITTIGLDHEEHLGNTIEAIAGEKAGILRTGIPAYYGDRPVPRTIREQAHALAAPLRCLGEDFDFTRTGDTWAWRKSGLALNDLDCPRSATLAQLQNASLALAVGADFLGGISLPPGRLNEVLRSARPPGRFQIVARRHQWILDVAHNPQAAAVLAEQLHTLPIAGTTVVLGMLADKHLERFVEPIKPFATRWVACGVEDPRARSALQVADVVRRLVDGPVHIGGSPVESFALAEQLSPLADRILVCGSFRIVGPALEWLGIY